MSISSLVGEGVSAASHFWWKHLGDRIIALVKGHTTVLRGLEGCIYSKTLSRWRCFLVLFLKIKIVSTKSPCSKQMKSDLSKPAGAMMILSQNLDFLFPAIFWNVFFLIFNPFSQQNILVPLYEHIQLKLGNLAICPLEALGYLSQCLKYLGTEPDILDCKFGMKSTWHDLNPTGVWSLFHSFQNDLKQSRSVKYDLTTSAGQWMGICQRFVVRFCWIWE